MTGNGTSKLSTLVKGGDGGNVWVSAAAIPPLSLAPRTTSDATLSLEAKGEVAALHKKSMRELFKYWNNVEGKMRFNRDRGRLEGASKEG